MARRKITAKGAEQEYPDLTGQQQAFVDAVLSRDSLVDAYRKAYNTENMGYASIRVEAARLRHKPHIALAISLGRSAAAESVKISHESWLEMMMAASEDAKRDGNHGANIAGLTKVGQSLGYLIEKHQEVPSPNAEQTLRDLVNEDPSLAQWAAAQASSNNIAWKADEETTKH